MSSAIQAIATGASLAHSDTEMLQADPSWMGMNELAANLGFHCWGYSAAPNCYTPTTMSLRISTYPREHIRNSIKYRLHPHGPAMAFAFRNSQPVPYKAVREQTVITRDVRAVLELNRRFAVTRGMVVPLRNVFGMVGLFALTYQGTETQLATLWEERGASIVEHLEWLNVEILGRHARAFTRDFIPILPERQLQIIKLLARGLSSDELADTLHISIHTVNKHVALTKEHLGAKTVAEATAHAVRWGLI
jgi:DNA-binding CsgD family transcriptional regulator